MSVESKSKFESLVDCINDEALASQQLLVISEQLAAVSNYLSTDFMSKTAMK